MLAPGRQQCLGLRAPEGPMAPEGSLEHGPEPAPPQVPSLAKVQEVKVLIQQEQARGGKGAAGSGLGLVGWG